jgi:hypothetical protein
MWVVFGKSNTGSEMKNIYATEAEALAAKEQLAALNTSAQCVFQFVVKEILAGQPVVHNW